MGSLSLDDLGRRYGTPLFLYDAERILARISRVKSAFKPLEPLIAYSVKANANGSILELMAQAGVGADVVSGGELFRALRAGISPRRIVFAGVGKTRDEMRYALESGILSLHVESAEELEVLADVAEGLGRVAPVGVRVNPDVEAITHEYTRTGHAASKFGVAPDEAVDLFRRSRERAALAPVGVGVHIGSQIRAVEPFLRALDVALGVVDRVRDDVGLALSYVDLGGGFGIADGAPNETDGSDAGEGRELDLEALGRGVVARMGDRPLTLALEPGRFLVGDAGVLLTRVLYVKRSGGRTFLVADAGMTELIRPSHYGGVHPVSLVRSDDGGAARRVDVVGPVCEQGDFLARDLELPVPRAGSLLCVRHAGAYGFAMASNYNSRLRPAEVMVRGGRARLIRRREDLGDLVRDEVRE